MLKAHKAKKPAAERCNRYHPLSPHARKKRKREEATVRQCQYESLHVSEKLAAIAGRRGESKRERSRLLRVQP